MKNNINYAPIIIFAFNRADRLKCLIECLFKNKDIDKMDLYIFVDVPDPKKDRRNIKFNEEVIDFLQSYDKNLGVFKSHKVIIAEQHKGLAKSIINGVTKIINEYGKAIVLEDDLEVSYDFLDYMQRGLEYYKNDKKIWSIAGHCPKLNVLKHYQEDVFLAPRPESLGWATWSDRWNRTDWDVKTYERFKRDYIGHVLFNLGGNDLCKMLRRQMEEPEFDSWAIRWGYQQFLERKYTVYPKESRVIHCGNDNRSTHGAYFSNQGIKEEYSSCRFTSLKLDYRILIAYRMANSKYIWSK